MVIDKCTVKIKGQLDFPVKYGGCAQRDDKEIFLCFTNFANWDSTTNKICYRSTGPFEKFSEIASSTYHHKWTSIATTSGEFSLEVTLSSNFFLETFVTYKHV